MTDSLAPDVVLPLLRGRFGHALPLRRALRRRPSGCSADDAPEGAVAVAEEQTEGRGRLGRAWDAPAGSSVLVSVLLRPAVDAPRLPELSLVAGGAVAQAIAEVTGPRAGDQVSQRRPCRRAARWLASWPRSSEGRVVLGIGVNVNQTLEQLPTDAKTEPTSLAPRARRACQPRAAARGDPAATRARLRRLGYGYFKVRLTFPAASFATMLTVRTRLPGRKEKAPALTTRVTRFPFTRQGNSCRLTHAKAQAPEGESAERWRDRVDSEQRGVRRPFRCRSSRSGPRRTSHPSNRMESRRPSAGRRAGRPSTRTPESCLPVRCRAEPKRHG